MNTELLVILVLILIVLTGMFAVFIKIFGFMKQSVYLMRAKFDRDFLRRFDQLYEHINKNSKFDIKLTKKGKIKKYMKDDRY